MRWRVTAAATLLLWPTLSGCVAALIPLAAMGTVTVSTRDRIRDAREARFAERLAREAETEAAALAAAATTPTATTPPPPAVSPGLSAIEAMGGPSRYAELARFALDRQARRSAGEAVTSMVTVDGFDIGRPAFVPCGTLPPAVVIDLDDANAGFDPALATPLTAERLRAEPGLAAELARLRAAGIAVLWLSDQGFEVDRAIYANLQASGLDTAGRDPLYAQMVPDDRKQGRRQEIASRYCVLAVAGDKRGDADEAYDFLIHAESAAPLESLWGKGWFIVPLPLRTVTPEPATPIPPGLTPPTTPQP